MVRVIKRLLRIRKNIKWVTPMDVRRHIQQSTERFYNSRVSRKGQGKFQHRAVIGSVFNENKVIGTT